MSSDLGPQNPQVSEPASHTPASPLPKRFRKDSNWSRDLVQHSRDLLCIHDLEGHLLFLNPGPARLLGYGMEELLRIPMRKLIPLRFQPQFDEYLQIVAREGEASGLLAVMTRGGAERIWEYHNRLQSDGASRPLVHGFAHDVTERVCIERELQDSIKTSARLTSNQETMLRELTLFRTLLDHSNDAIEVVDPKTLRLLDVNEKACLELGYSRDELLGMSVHDIHPGIQPERLTQTCEKLRKAGSVVLESERRRKDGTTFPVEMSLRLVGLDREYLVSISRDITTRRLRDERLREYERLLEGLTEMVMVLDRDHRYVLANRAFLRNRQITREQVVGRHAREILGSEVYENTVKPKLEEGFQGKVVNYPLKLSYPEIGGRDLLVTYLPVEGPAGIDRVAGIIHDVTERELAEEALRESEEWLCLAQDAAQMGTFDRKLITGEVRWTRQMEAIYGLQPGGYPRTLAELMELIHPDDRKYFLELIVRSKEVGKGGGEWRVVWPDGRVHWLAGRWRVFKDAQGQPVRIIGIDYDITDRKRIEEELRLAKERLTEEKLYLEHEIDIAAGFDEIIGRSKGLKSVMQSVARVANSDATVLLLGETGTGKELVARAIHRLSGRAGNAFIKMNCAAIPSGLLESELFGAEKGAYTGSTSRKIGRLELADTGTLFLDEIGEIALALQPKLLRVLQDREFERLGGTRTLKVDFRLIAATNRDLGGEVRENQFRSDLYYRLNVFPIYLPPLRERRDDIPLLVEHFVKKCAQRMGKPITSIPKKTMDVLAAWDWPGNIRELENFIERSVILTNGSVLAAPLIELHARIAENGGSDETLEGVERRHILDALRQANGRISGKKGAAARLGLKRTTLQSKLKQMGINPRATAD